MYLVLNFNKGNTRLYYIKRQRWDLGFLDGGDRLFPKFVSPVLVFHKVEEDSFLEDRPKYGRFRYKVTFFEFVNKLQKRNI